MTAKQIVITIFLAYIAICVFLLIRNVIQASRPKKPIDPVKERKKRILDEKINNTISLALSSAMVGVIIAGLLTDAAEGTETTARALLYEWLNNKDPLLLIVILPAALCLLMLIVIWFIPDNPHNRDRDRRHNHNQNHGDRKEHHHERRRSERTNHEHRDNSSRGGNSSRDRHRGRKKQSGRKKR